MSSFRTWLEEHKYVGEKPANTQQYFELPTDYNLAYSIIFEQLRGVLPAEDFVVTPQKMYLRLPVQKNSILIDRINRFQNGTGYLWSVFDALPKPERQHRIREYMRNKEQLDELLELAKTDNAHLEVSVAGLEERLRESKDIATKRN